MTCVEVSTVDCVPIEIDVMVGALLEVTGDGLIEEAAVPIPDELDEVPASVLDTVDDAAVVDTPCCALDGLGELPTEENSVVKSVLAADADGIDDCADVTALVEG